MLVVRGNKCSVDLGEVYFLGDAEALDWPQNSVEGLVVKNDERQ